MGIRKFWFPKGGLNKGGAGEGLGLVKLLRYC